MSKGRYVPTKTLIAQRTGISYQRLLSNWDRPGRPKDHSPGKARYDVHAYQHWINGWKSAHNFGSRNGDSYHPLNEREKALADKNKIIAERQRFLLDCEKREKLDRTEVNERITRNATMVKRELYKAFEQELPPRTANSDALEVKKANRRKLDEVLRGFPLLFANADGKI